METGPRDEENTREGEYVQSVLSFCFRVATSYVALERCAPGDVVDLCTSKSLFPDKDARKGNVSHLRYVVAARLEHAEILIKAYARVAGRLYNGEGRARVQGGCHYEASYEVNGAHIDAIVDIRSSGELYAA